MNADWMRWFVAVAILVTGCPAARAIDASLPLSQNCC